MATTDQLISAQEEGRALAGEFYTSPEIFRLEMEEIYERQWLFVGHLSEIRDPGDFFVYQVGRESIVIIRVDVATVRAFFNVCRHRGSPLCTQSSGNTKEFVCPYHSWAYDLTGRLRSAKRMGMSFDYSAHNLFKCHVEIVDGLIFISMADEAPPFGRSQEVIKRFVEPHGLENAVLCHTLTQEIAANWKIIAENSWECYHCPVAHRLYSQVMPYSRATASAHERARQAALTREWEAKMRSRGVLTGGVELSEESAVWCQRYPLRPGFSTQSIDGAPVAPLMGSYGEYDNGVTAVQMLPACGFSLCSDYTLLCRITPRSLSLTEVKYYWLVASEARVELDYQVDRLTAFWRITANEDLSLCENTQRGVQSSRYIPGPLGEVEIDVARFTQWYLSRLRGSK